MTTRETYRYAIIIVVDQLRPEYIQHSLTPNLFRIFNLGSDGCLKCDASYIPTTTETCHATFATGVSPGNHGIIGDGCFNRSVGRYASYWSQESVFLEQHYPSDQILTRKASQSGFSVFTVAGKEKVVDLLSNSQDYLRVKLSPSGTLPPYYEVKPIGRQDIEDQFKRLIELSGLDRLPSSALGTPALDCLVSNLVIKAMDMIVNEPKWLIFVGLSALDYIGHRYGPVSTEPNVAESIRVVDNEIGRTWRASLNALGYDDDLTTDDAPVLLVVTGDHGCRPIRHGIIPYSHSNKWVWENIDLWEIRNHDESSYLIGRLSIPSQITSLIRWGECDGGTIRLWLQDPGHSEQVIHWINEATFSNGVRLRELISELNSTQNGSLPEWLQSSLHKNLGDLVLIAGEDCAFFKPRWIAFGIREQGRGSLPCGEHGTHFLLDRLVPLLVPRSDSCSALRTDQLNHYISTLLGLSL